MDSEFLKNHLVVLKKKSGGGGINYFFNKAGSSSSMKQRQSRIKQTKRYAVIFFILLTISFCWFLVKRDIMLGLATAALREELRQEFNSEDFNRLLRELSGPEILQKGQEEYSYSWHKLLSTGDTAIISISVAWHPFSYKFYDPYVKGNRGWLYVLRNPRAN